MWNRALHEYIVKRLLASPRFHRFVRASNARIRGEPVPPEDEYTRSASSIRMNKLRVFGRLFVEEFKNVLTGR